MIFFLTSQKVGGIASVNYLKAKNDVTYLNTIIPVRNQIAELIAFKQLHCRSTSPQPATHYCTRPQGLKERRVLGSVGIFSF